jgi:hypothetical protein
LEQEDPVGTRRSDTVCQIEFESVEGFRWDPALRYPLRYRTRIFIKYRSVGPIAANPRALRGCSRPIGSTPTITAAASLFRLAELRQCQRPET